MGRGGILIILICSLWGIAHSQESINYRQVDSATYMLYQSANWKDLIHVGKQALENEIDYYYLRQRMGWAYYNMKNFRAAARQFEAAEYFNQTNTITQEYLYYSYFFSGQWAEATYKAAGMNARQREQTGIQNPGIFTAVYWETGPEFSNNYEQNCFKGFPDQQDLQYQDLYGNSYYTNLGVLLHVHPRLNIFTAYSNLHIDKKAQIQYTWNSPDSIVTYEWGFSKVFPIQRKISGDEYNYSILENNGFIRANVYLGNGWQINPATHYIHLKTKRASIVNVSRMVQDTAFYIEAIDSVNYFQYNLVQFKLESEDLYEDLFVISLGIVKRAHIFDIGIFGSWSNMFERNQYQYGLKLDYYPLGNLWLYGSTTLKGLSDESETRAIFMQMIGGKISRFLWAEAFGAFGNLRGTNESDAYIVYNLTDQIDMKAGLNLIFVVSPSIQLSVRYQYLQKTGFRYTYGPGNRPGGGIKHMEYVNQSVIGGLKWNF